MNLKKTSFLLTTLILLSLFGSVQAVSPKTYQDELKIYNTKRSIFVSQRANYQHAKNNDNLILTVNSARDVIIQRSQVLSAYATWLSEMVTENLVDVPDKQAELLAALDGFNAQFQSHMKQGASIQDTSSLYSSDDNFTLIKQRFDILAYQVFTALYSHGLRSKFDTLQNLHTQQGSDILARASNEVTRTSYQLELDRLAGVLLSLESQLADLESTAPKVQNKQEYDSWKAQADAFLNQLIRSIRDFDQLWTS